MDCFLYARSEDGLSSEAICSAVRAALARYRVRRALILPPDHTRLHSGAGFLTRVAWEALTAAGASVDIMPALGTHAPMTEAEIRRMFGDLPLSAFLVHDWRRDVVRLGEVPGDYIAGITDGLWTEGVAAEVNRRVMDESYDLIFSPGQVVPHEVVGMSNHAKNLFVGAGGSDMINKSHMIGAVYGMERMMGRDHTPVRKLFDYAAEHFLAGRPILYALTVTTAPEGRIRTHGLFLGEGRDCLTAAVKLAQEKNIDFVPHGLRKCVVWLDPDEFHSTWLGNKAIYRTRMAMADGGELIILAPGVSRFGEDPLCDRLIRKYGYKGRLQTLEAFRRPENGDLRANMSAAAHLIHGSSDGRFTVTYAAGHLTREEVEGAGFAFLDPEEALKRYDPRRLEPGENRADGEDIFYIPNPALGLWIDRERFQS